MNAVALPEGFRVERLSRRHPRREFRCGEPQVDDWLAAKALQSQEKRLSVTKVLLDAMGRIVGYYTLATGQVELNALPGDLTKGLPRRILPVAVLAWLGVSQDCQRQGTGGRLLAQALRDCHEAAKTFPFIAVIVDCVNDAAKAFYRRWDFEEVPGHPHRLFLSSGRLDAMMRER